jgi:hypothetical protein
MELDNGKNVTKEVVIIAKKTAQKENSVLLKVPIKLAQLLNTVSCNREADLFVEMEKHHWHSGVYEQSGVQDDTVNCIEEMGSLHGCWRRQKMKNVDL